MHFKSEKQRRFMWSQHPEIAEKWAHGKHSTKGKGKRKKKRSAFFDQSRLARVARGCGRKDAEVADIPVAMVPSTGEITLLQMDGKVQKEELHAALEQARPALQRIADIQRQAIKQRYAGYGAAQ